MKPTPAPLRSAAGAARRCLCALAAAQTQVGPPNFVADAAVEVYRGASQPRLVDIVQASGYKSAGSGQVAVVTELLPWIGQRPTGAEAQADDFTLRANSAATGVVMSDLVQTPHILARAKAETTRFWEVQSPYPLVDIPLTFDGLLGAAWIYAELPQAGTHASIRYRLTLDEPGKPLLTLAELQAEIRWQPSSSQFQLTRSTQGPVDPSLWASAFTPVPVSGWAPGVGLGFDIGHIETLDTPEVLQPGTVYGITWTLEVESLMLGDALSGALIADFSHTAHIGLGRSDAELAALGVFEVLTVPPPVPEPGSALLLGLGLLPLWRRARRRPG